MRPRLAALVVLIALLFPMTSTGQELVFADTFDDPTPLDVVMGDYNLSTRHDLGSAYPRQTIPMGSLMAGDYVDVVVGLFADPGLMLADAILAVPEVETGVTDINATRTLLETVFGDVINDAAPDMLPFRATIAADVGSVLNTPNLLGQLLIPTEPDMTGLVQNGSHAYFAIRIPWQYPCAVDPNSTCDPLDFNLRALTGDPTLTVTTQIEINIIDQSSLTIPQHAVLTPYSAIFRGFVENFAIPVAFEDPAVNSVDDLIDKLLRDWAIDTYNASPPGQANPIFCPICDCADSGFAIESLLLQAGSIAADAALIGQHACSAGISLLSDQLNDALDRITDDDIEDIWETATACRFTDPDEDLIADGFGPSCTWSTDIQFDLAEPPVMTSARFFGSIDGL